MNHVKKKFSCNEIIQECFDYFKKLKKKSIDINKSGFTYFCIWENTIGLEKLKTFLYKKYFSLFYNYFLNIYRISYLSNFEVENKVALKDKENLFISWESSKSIEKNFYHSYRYISYFERERKSSIWFLIDTNQIYKKNNLKNAIFFYRKKVFFNFLYTIKTFFNLLKKNKFNFIKLIHEFNCESIFSEILKKKLFIIIKKNKFKKIIISYEGQPFQKYLISNVKQNFPNIKIYCDIHSFQPSYFHLMNLNYQADYYVTHDKYQKNFLIKFFKYPRKKIIYKKFLNTKKKKDLIGKVFLPYSLNHQKCKIIINSLKSIQLKKKLNLENFALRPHPVSKHDYIYRQQIKKLKKIFKFRGGEKKEIIVIGSSNVIFEALFLNLNVIQITLDGFYDRVLTFFWKKIKEGKIQSNIFHYSLK